MRLSILDNGHRRRAKLFMGMTATMSRVESPDIVKILLYRPGFSTRALLDLTAPAMRGDSYWTAAEREYLAMRTAQVHQCPFCAVTHTEMIRIAAHGEVNAESPDSARPELRAVSDFLETISSGAGTVSLDEVRSAGVPDDAILQALRVNVVWNVVNRLANAFGFELRDGQLESGTRALHRFGYRFPGFLLSGGDRTKHGDAVDDLRHAVLDGPGVTSAQLRKAAADGTIDEPWRSYVDKVRDTSFKVTDEDVAALRAGGHSEDEVFEITVAAALGAALRAYDVGRAALAG